MRTERVRSELHGDERDDPTPPSGPTPWCCGSSVATSANYDSSIAELESARAKIPADARLRAALKNARAAKAAEAAVIGGTD